MRLLLYLFLLLASCSWQACIDTREELPDEAIGMAPIYAVDDWDVISIDGPRSINQLGKLYYKSPYLFATERGQGIHVFDNSDPSDPQPLAFLRIAGNADLSIKGDILYANNVADLVAIDISRLDTALIVDRQKDVFDNVGVNFPEGYRGYFECVNAELGTVVGWYETTLTKPQCWR